MWSWSWTPGKHSFIRSCHLNLRFPSSVYLNLTVRDLKSLWTWCRQSDISRCWTKSTSLFKGGIGTDSLLQTRFMFLSLNLPHGQRGSGKGVWHISTLVDILETPLRRRSLTLSPSNWHERFSEDPMKGYVWVMNAFSVTPTKNTFVMSSQVESQLPEVSKGITLKLQCGELDLGFFWIAVSKECPCLAPRLWKLLLHFMTT